jgi:hypothetical protein
LKPTPKVSRRAAAKKLTTYPLITFYFPLPTYSLFTFYFLLHTFYFLLSTLYFLLSTFYFLLRSPPIPSSFQFSQNSSANRHSFRTIPGCNLAHQTFAGAHLPLCFAPEVFTRKALRRGESRRGDALTGLKPER